MRSPPLLEENFKNPLNEESQRVKTPDPCVVVIFGATGDLTGRKLLPALYNLQREGQLPPHFACVGFARRQKENPTFRKEMHDAVNQFSRVKPVDPSVWETFESKLFYHVSEFHEDAGYESLKKSLEEIDKKLGTKGNRIYYLSIQPSFFPLVIEKLRAHGLIYPPGEKGRWSRVIIEKPFGRDLASAVALQKEITTHLAEEQLYRIDHYLGKETVQNMLVFRFGNSIFEALWNHRYIDHVQITVGEEIGIGSRGAFFEEAGILRDIVQNHLMQLLALVAMEPPSSLDADAIRDEKVKVLEALRPIDQEHFNQYVVRGQYGGGFVEGQKVIGYREEQKVNPHSPIETYVALEAHIDNWRWAGVPFYLRAGKRLPKRTTTIALVFKPIPHILFAKESQAPYANVLMIRIQPNEGISLKIHCKVPGPRSPIQPVTMDFNYGSFFGMAPPEAYERLIFDCMAGDSTLFARVDEVFASWRFLTPILDHWQQSPQGDFPNYVSGSWGPAAADALLAREGRAWKML